MKRFILTGAPGSGKTAILRQLELEGLGVVEESATDIIALQQARGIAEPWKNPAFIDTVASLQKQRQMRASLVPDLVQFHDRSAVCTAALASYLGFSITPSLHSELDRIKREQVFEPRVFFVRNLGFITHTEARRISWDEALRFERIHEYTYREHGFEMITIAPGPLPERIAAIKRAL